MCVSVTDLNIGRLVQGDVGASFVPPVASAVVELLGRHGENGKTLGVTEKAFMCNKLIFGIKMLHQKYSGMKQKSFSVTLILPR